MRLIAALLVLALTTPAFAKGVLKRGYASPPTRMLTIGTKHFFAMEPRPMPEMMALVLDRLARWKPEVITREGVSGEQCELLKAQGPRNPGKYASYCDDPASAQRAAGVDLQGALTAIEAMMLDWPTSPSASQRRRLALLFLASGDVYSARVQWLQLASADRISADGVTAELLSVLNRAHYVADEGEEIGVALAVRLGLQRIYLVDDKTADAVMTPIWPQIAAASDRLWAVPPAPAIVRFEAASANIATPEQMLGFVRIANSRATQRALANEGQGRLMQDQQRPWHGRVAVAAWEARNMNMAANIRAAAATKPGARVLNIVGAAHKPWYDAYLSMMSDVEVEDAEAVLK